MRARRGGAQGPRKMTDPNDPAVAWKDKVVVLDDHRLRPFFKCGVDELTAIEFGAAPREEHIAGPYIAAVGTDVASNLCCQWVHRW